MAKDEGVASMFSGATVATMRAVVMTVGQLSVYDQVKLVLLYTGLFEDNPNLHFTSSIITVKFPKKFCKYLPIKTINFLGNHCNNYNATIGCSQDAHDER